MVKEGRMCLMRYVIVESGAGIAFSFYHGSWRCNLVLTSCRLGLWNLSRRGLWRKPGFRENKLFQCQKEKKHQSGNRKSGHVENWNFTEGFTLHKRGSWGSWGITKSNHYNVEVISFCLLVVYRCPQMYGEQEEPGTPAWQRSVGPLKDRLEVFHTFNLIIQCTHVQKCHSVLNYQAQFLCLTEKLNKMLTKICTQMHSHKEERSHAVCGEMGTNGWRSSKWMKSLQEKQMPYVFSQLWF